MPREKIKALIYGLLAMLTLAILIVVGSRNLTHFDAALVGYTFATLFATFGIVYRYTMWLQRPPTAVYWQRGWQLFLRPAFIVGNLALLLRRVSADFAVNNFIARRGRPRWIAHWLIMWGCLTAAAVTFPLVFGWIHFETVPGNAEIYRTFVFGIGTFDFPVKSLVGFLVFHALVWASILVIGGVMLAMRRRMREHGVAALQRFGEDFLPLIMLFAISITGLMLTASYTWMSGYGYDFLALLHAITVIFTLLWLPFGKFFHIFQRPAQLGVSFYKDAGARGAQAECRRCQTAYAPQLQIEDLIKIEGQLGFRYETSNNSVEHYQRICPACRRRLVVIAQGRLVNQRKLRVSVVNTDKKVGATANG